MLCSSQCWQSRALGRGHPSEQRFHKIKRAVKAPCAVQHVRHSRHCCRERSSKTNDLSWRRSTGAGGRKQKEELARRSEQQQDKSLVSYPSNMKPLFTSWWRLLLSQHGARKPHPVLVLHHTPVSVSDFFVCQTLTGLLRLPRASSAQQLCIPLTGAARSSVRGSIRALLKMWIHDSEHRAEKSLEKMSPVVNS